MKGLNTLIKRLEQLQAIINGLEDAMASESVEITIETQYGSSAFMETVTAELFELELSLHEINRYHASHKLIFSLDRKTLQSVLKTIKNEDIDEYFESIVESMHHTVTIDNGITESKFYFGIKR